MEEKEVKKVSPFHGLQLLIVQSTVCILVIAIALLLRVIGGNVYTDIGMRFQNAMFDETLLSVIAKPIETDTVSAESSSTKEAKMVNAPSTLKNNSKVCAPLTGGIVTSQFGEREDPFDDTAVSLHNGVDIAAPEGTPLAALMDGIVMSVDYEEDGYGHYIIVDCNDGHSYLYAHCSQIKATKGQSVKAGDVIAVVGNTGRSTGSHLHFEWRENNVPADPVTVLPESTYA